MDKQETLKRIEEDKELKGKLLDGGDMEEVLKALEATTYPSGTGTRKGSLRWLTSWAGREEYRAVYKRFQAVIP